MNKKTLMITFIGLILVLSWGTRVYCVNKGVAKAYDIQTFNVGDKVPIQQANITVSSTNYGAVKEQSGTKFVPFTIHMQVTNSSKENVSVIKLIEAKLAYGREYYQTKKGEFNVIELKKLGPGKTTTIKLQYDVRAKHKGERAMLYLSQGLYVDKVKKEYDLGKRYGIAVKLYS